MLTREKPKEKHVIPLLAALVFMAVSCGNNGQGNASEEGNAGNLTAGGHAYVDLGLSVKWAALNIGANSPTEGGTYFAWGETAEKDAFFESNCQTFIKDMPDIAGNPNNDPAAAIWGDGWRLPTKEEISDLTDKCEWTWISSNDSVGYEIKGPNGNKIFMPASGRYYGETLFYENQSGHYWSSTPASSEYSFFLFMTRGKVNVGFRNRHYGFTVRAVRD